MAGMSSRFFKAGYDKPKYMLEAHGKSLFEYSVESFNKYFDTEKFLFIVKNVFDTESFVQKKAEELGIKSFHVICLEHDTRGQAETVSVGLEILAEEFEIRYESLTIFNIDTFRLGFSFPKVIDNCDGYLEVFEGEGDNWSFAEPESSGSTRVVKTAEKNPISNLCSTGLYYFKSVEVYLDAYYNYLNKPFESWEKQELYIAPLYNYLILNDFHIHYNLISESEVIFCGIPDEYMDFCAVKL